MAGMPNSVKYFETKDLASSEDQSMNDECKPELTMRRQAFQKLVASEGFVN
jgi:hypothetical protein